MLAQLRILRGRTASPVRSALVSVQATETGTAGPAARSSCGSTLRAGCGVAVRLAPARQAVLLLSLENRMKPIRLPNGKVIETDAADPAEALRLLEEQERIHAEQVAQSQQQLPHDPNS